MKRKAVEKSYLGILKRRFEANLSTLHSVEFDRSEHPKLYLAFDAHVIEITFPNDSGREQWRRALAMALNQKDTLWQRTWVHL